jgi:exodeoxyribonuclease-3
MVGRERRRGEFSLGLAPRTENGGLRRAAPGATAGRIPAPDSQAPRTVRVITLNVNGIRSAARKGLFAWLARQRADIVCLQELKAQEADLDHALHAPKGFCAAYSLAVKKGYSGVALYSRAAPDAVVRGFGSREFDPEGRCVEARYGKLSVISVYLPSGSAGPHRQASKFRFLDEFLPHLRKLRRSGREVILCGDWNIAHKEIDLKNWRSNQKNSGFLPEERAWLTKVFDDEGFVDVFRRLNSRPEQYTWWSNRGQAWAKNVGWRIDYQIATPGVAKTAVREAIYKAKRFSDHAPLTVDYAWGSR